MCKKMFESAEAIPRLHPGDIISNDELWADASKKANCVTRSPMTNEACVTISILQFGGFYLHYAVPESSAVLLNAEFYRLIMSALGEHLVRRSG
jgi:hypothetical protein